MRKPTMRLRQFLSSSIVVLALGALPPDASAASLTLSWAPNSDDVTAGYQVEVLDREGNSVRTIDVGAATRATVEELADNTLYRFRIRPYDTAGNRARQPSSELVTFAAPRVDELRGDLESGRTAPVAIHGVNFHDGARLVSRRSDVRVLSVTVIRPDLIVARVALSTGAPAITSRDLTVVNAARRAPAFVARHRGLLDVDQSGTIDADDHAKILAAFGHRAEDADFDAALDVDGDGVIDGEDAAKVRAALNDNSTSPASGP